jgi:hypothetical protein
MQMMSVQVQERWGEEVLLEVILGGGGMSNKYNVPARKAETERKKEGMKEWLRRRTMWRSTTTHACKKKRKERKKVQRLYIHMRVGYTDEWNAISDPGRVHWKVGICFKSVQQGCAIDKNDKVWGARLCVGRFESFFLAKDRS